MNRNLLYLVTLIFLMLVTGVFWGTWFTLTRSIGDFSPAEFRHIGQVIISNVAVGMRILVITSLLFIIFSLWVGRKKKGFMFGVGSLVMFVAVLFMTLLILVPIDNQIKTWNNETIPQNWDDLRSRWATWHAVRTFFSLAGFICYGVFASSDTKTGVDRKYKLEKKNKGLWI